MGRLRRDWPTNFGDQHSLAVDAGLHTIPQLRSIAYRRPICVAIDHLGSFVDSVSQRTHDVRASGPQSQGQYEVCAGKLYTRANLAAGVCLQPLHSQNDAEQAV